MATGVVKNRKEKTFPFKIDMELTEKERLAYGDEIAQLDQDLDDAELRLQSARGKHKDEIAQINGRRKVVLNYLRTKKEPKPVECFKQLNWVDGLADYIRVDTGEIVHTRRMTQEEYRGTPLFDDMEIQEVEVSEGRSQEADPEPEEDEDDDQT